MLRKEYITKITDVLEAVDSLIALNACVEAQGLPQSLTDIEKKRRKATNSAIEGLHDRLFTDIAISEREAREAAERGDTEQDELDFTGGEPAAAEDASETDEGEDGKAKPKKRGKKGKK